MLSNIIIDGRQVSQQRTSFSILTTYCLVNYMPLPMKTVKTENTHAQKCKLTQGLAFDDLYNTTTS
jgi:hypothetical protein